MAEPNVIPGDLQVKGRGSFGTITLPTSVVSNSNVASDAAIDASKLVHMVNVCTELYGPSTTVAALTKECYIAKGIGSLSSVRAAINGTIATGADRTVTVDLQKSTAGGAFATVLSGTCDFTNGSSLRTLSTGTISSATYAAGDLFRWVVTVAGAAGNQAIGLVADFVTYEATT